MRRGSVLLYVGDIIYRFAEKISTILGAVTDNRLLHSSTEPAILMFLFGAIPLLLIVFLSFVFFKMLLYDKEIS